MFLPRQYRYRRATYLDVLIGLRRQGNARIDLKLPAPCRTARLLGIPSVSPAACLEALTAITSFSGIPLSRPDDSGELRYFLGHRRATYGFEFGPDYRPCEHDSWQERQPTGPRAGWRYDAASSPHATHRGTKFEPHTKNPVKRKWLETSPYQHVISLFTYLIADRTRRPRVTSHHQWLQVARLATPAYVRPLTTFARDASHRALLHSALPKISVFSRAALSLETPFEKTVYCISSLAFPDFIRGIREIANGADRERGALHLRTSRAKAQGQQSSHQAPEISH